jgi:hypothetical protein
MLKTSSSVLRHRRGEGNGGVIVVILIVGGIILWCSNTPDGKKAFMQAVAAVQPPVQISLTPFLVFNGYYVNITNTSSGTTLNGVTVTYTGASGNSMTQALGTLRPGETRTLDPTAVRWTVEQHQTISVSASGMYVPKVLETNVLIKR